MPCWHVDAVLSACTLRSFRMCCHKCIAYGYEINRRAHFGQTSVRRVVRNVGPVRAMLVACLQRCSLLVCLLLVCLLLHCLYCISRSNYYTIELAYHRMSVWSGRRT